MTIIVNDETSGIEINLGPSETRPERVNVTIFAVRLQDLTQVIEDLAMEYGQAAFTEPVKCADGKKWGAVGQVWRDKS